MKNKKKLFKKIFCWLVILGFLPFFSAQAAGASLFFTPSAGTYAIDSNFSVNVRLDSGGEVINASEGTISFDKNLLAVAGISENSSIFTMWIVKPSFSNSKGEINFSGGIPKPGFNGQSGLLFTINFKAIKAGSALIRFSSGAVLANDEKGSNILATMASANFIISPKVIAPAQSDEKVQPAADTGSSLGQIGNTQSGEYYNQPVITSPTHPDQNTWSQENNVKFSWKLPEMAKAISFTFNKEPVAEPKDETSDLITEKEYNKTADGIWYFHIKFKDNNKWSDTTHYRVMIDSTPPIPFEIRIRQLQAGEWPILNFETKDNGSGIKKYEIIIGSLENKSYELDGQENSFKVTNLEAGEHTAIVKAIDNAGNVTYSEIKFNIEPIESPKILNYPTEIKSSDKFYISGTALPDTDVNIFLLKGDKVTVNTKVKSDNNGNWFFINQTGLENDRYIAYAEAINENGVKSLPSVKVTFLVTPPVFTRIGSWVINYFTVFASLLFVAVLIVLLIIFLVNMARKKLRKETVEVEQVAGKYLAELKNVIDEEFNRLDKIASGSREYKKEKMETKRRLKINIEGAEKKIAKELKDVEDILK
jgi:hypothetical protein